MYFVGTRIKYMLIYHMYKMYVFTVCTMHICITRCACTYNSSDETILHYMYILITTLDINYLSYQMHICLTTLTFFSHQMHISFTICTFPHFIIPSLDAYLYTHCAHQKYMYRIMCYIIFVIRNGFLGHQNQCLNNKIIFMFALQLRISLLLALVMAILVAILNFSTGS